MANKRVNLSENTMLKFALLDYADERGEHDPHSWLNNDIPKEVLAKKLNNLKINVYRNSDEDLALAIYVDTYLQKNIRNKIMGLVRKRKQKSLRNYFDRPRKVELQPDVFQELLQLKVHFSDLLYLSQNMDKVEREGEIETASTEDEYGDFRIRKNITYSEIVELACIALKEKIGKHVSDDHEDLFHNWHKRHLAVQKAEKVFQKKRKAELEAQREKDLYARKLQIFEDYKAEKIRVWTEHLENAEKSLSNAKEKTSEKRKFLIDHYESTINSHKKSIQKWQEMEFDGTEKYKDHA